VDFEWDETKRQANIVKHGVDFVRAARVFESTLLTKEERRQDYREERLSSLGESEGEIFYVVYTHRGANIRIISARQAGLGEREEYYKGLAQRSS